MGSTPITAAILKVSVGELEYPLSASWVSCELTRLGATYVGTSVVDITTVSIVGSTPITVVIECVRETFIFYAPVVKLEWPKPTKLVVERLL